MSAPFRVFDDWLPAPHLAAARAFLREFRYFTTTPTGKRGPLGTLAELKPLLDAGELKLLGGSFLVYRTEPSIKTERDVYPSGGALDLVLDSVRARMKELEPFLGKERSDWNLLGTGPRLYPKGRGLPLHDDARFVGTFTLYLHEEWRPEWGGRLLIEGAEPVFPKPNRIVFLRGGHPHAVEDVAEAAGDRLRMSLIGYTYRARSNSSRDESR